ncbi:MAG: SpoIIE family protein phosphatase [Oscillospiraceae bacterium]|nr:SpoIIE family protein phosphatase [Oscillospiraceae bacterium]
MDLKEMPKKWDALRRTVCTGKTARILLSLGLRAAVGWLLASGVMFGEYAPLGLGYLAAQGQGVFGMSGILGTVLGYLCHLYRANGLKYLAISALICTARFVFAEQKNPWIMPCAAAGSTLLLGGVFLLDGGVQLIECIFFLSEVLLVFGTTALYQMIQRKHRKLPRLQEQMVLFCLAATLLYPLVRVQLFSVISLGRILALFCVMVAGYFGGTGLGVIASVVFGITAGSAYCAAYGVATLVASALKKRGILAFLCGYLSVSLFGMLLLQYQGGIGLGMETLVAAAVFCVAKRRFGAELRTRFGERKCDSLPIQTVTRESLRAAAKAFLELGEMLSRIFSKEQASENIATVFERPARLVCKKCVLCNRCWQEEYNQTRTALSDATSAMLEHRELKAGDLPMHFSTKCLHLGAFVAQVNRELGAYFCRKQYKNRLRESREQLCGQYRDVSKVFSSIAEGEMPVADTLAQKRLLRILRERGIAAEVCVYRDEKQHLRVLVESEEVELSDALNAFSEESGVPLGTPERVRKGSGWRTCVSERRVFHASLGVASRRKSGNSVCGDTVGHCRLPNGNVCVLLADGMGTGKSAARESSLAVDLLIRFLESGIDPQSALAIVRSALQVKCEETNAFTTLDLLCVDLFGGQSVLYRFGSAPAYFRRNEEIECVTCTSMPLGIVCPEAPSVERVCRVLKSGEDVLLMSDGVSDQASPPWLMHLLREKHALSPQALAREILTASELEETGADDRTVLILRICEE